MNTLMRKTLAAIFAVITLISCAQRPSSYVGRALPCDPRNGIGTKPPSAYVDPKIGSEGLGRTFVGPSMPYGMIKPSPDCVSMPNSGWAPMPEPIKGFSQVHVSGTGGGQKYGNILVMPFDANASVCATAHTDVRTDETVTLGYYATRLASGIGVELTCANKAAIYDFCFPKGATAALAFDAGAFLGVSDIPDQRETQQLVGSQIQILSDHEVCGYNRVRGGWNNGRAYTVYFYAVTSAPMTKYYTWEANDSSSCINTRPDHNKATGAAFVFDKATDSLQLKIGISYLSELKARENLYAEIPDWDFERVLAELTDSWDALLSRVELSSSATDRQKRMLYTGLYHTMIMPVDRTGENPLWSDPVPYYDDYYAIWDTYRTSSPMITLLDPDRQRDIVVSLLNIYKRDGYMPDARSGNCNGRTQGGSNADVVIADAYIKGLTGIDYRLALEAMLKDADVPPGGNEEAEGRGAVTLYNSLGYVPYGIPRAGNRTVEYAFCDYAIAQVAKGLGETALYDRFMRQSGNWRNLWRDDYSHAGHKGFIMPRDADGTWLDSLPQGYSSRYQPKYKYTAMTFEGPWYTPWWSMFFYEAPSWEYSLSIPHDVPGLIEKSGGSASFENRLDTFFDKGFYNVNNEPSFLSPMLYHWIGKPHRSSDRVRQIVDANFDDSALGLPGNDDSGAMSSWLAFNMLGLYPNAAHDYYLINAPMIESCTLHLTNGNDFTIRAVGLSGENRYIAKATLDGVDYPYSTITHDLITRGGTLQFTMASKPASWGNLMAPASEVSLSSAAGCDTPRVENTPLISVDTAYCSATTFADLLFVFKLHGQTRRYKMSISPTPTGGAIITWEIERNLKWQKGSFVISPQAAQSGHILDLSMPIDGQNVTLPDCATAYMVSRDALRRLTETGRMVYNNTEFRLVDRDGGLVHAVDINEGTRISILDNPHLPIICSMSDNPLEQNWTVRF